MCTRLRVTCAAAWCLLTMYTQGLYTTLCTVLVSLLPLHGDVPQVLGNMRYSQVWGFVELL